MPNLPVVPSFSDISAAADCANKAVADAMISALLICFRIMFMISPKKLSHETPFTAALAKERDRCLK
jgi:hypothetical protein